MTVGPTNDSEHSQGRLLLPEGGHAAFGLGSIRHSPPHDDAHCIHNTDSITAAKWKHTMKIGIVCFPGFGGSGVVATELGKALSERDHCIHFFCHEKPFRLPDLTSNIYYHSIDVCKYHALRQLPYDLTLAGLIAQTARREQIQIVHAHYAVPHSVSAFLANIILDEKLKMITTLHGTDITILSKDKNLSSTMQAILNTNHAITAVSDFLTLEAQSVFDLKISIRRIYNFVDLNIYCPNKEKNDNRGNRRIVIHVSNFRPLKRVHDVIRAFELIHQRVCCRLVLVGDGPDYQSARQLVEELQIGQHVAFMGNCPNVVDLLNKADLLLLPSLTESFGLAALEGMACGVPTIASNVGGLPELVVHGKTGFLCGVGDITVMAEYAVRLLSDTDMHSQFSRACIQRAVTVFSKEQAVSHYEELYRSVLE